MCDVRADGSRTRRLQRSQRAERAVLILLRTYKLLLSPLFAGSCRFLPTCSEYAALAVTRHGWLKGGWLAVRRLSRCQPFGAAGWDPVPEPHRAESHPPERAVS